MRHASDTRESAAAALPLPHVGGDVAEAVRALSSIGSTLSASYAALERRAARVEQELERKVAELDAVTRHLEALLEALPTGVVVRDGDEVVVRANRAAREILSVESEPLIGLRDLPLVGRTACEGSEWVQREVERGDGARRVLATRRSRVPHGGWVELIDDRTELDALNQRLHALDKLAALGHMAGGIAHELRNPMHAAKGFAALLERRLEPDSKERHYARRIVEGIAGAEEILTSMLGLASPDRLRMEAVQADALVREAHAAALEGRLAEGEPSPWCFEAAVPALRFLADRVKLRQALRNLIANAFDAQPQGGTVRVDVATDAQSRELTMVVSDAGPGVPAALRARVLEPFFTTRADGTGLGLALVATIAGWHGGRVEILQRRSPLGGAQIAISLPLQIPEPS